MGELGADSRLTILDRRSRNESLTFHEQRFWVLVSESHAIVGWRDGRASAVSAAVFTGQFRRILGTVTDQSGGVISGATVTVTDTERGVTKTLVTNEPESTTLPTSLPGRIKFASSQRFQDRRAPERVLEVGKEIRVD